MFQSFGSCHIRLLYASRELESMTFVSGLGERLQKSRTGFRGSPSQTCLREGMEADVTEDHPARRIAVRKTWNYGMALAFGISCLPSIASAQYSAPYGNGSLAPSGYAINPAYAAPTGGYPNYQVPPQAGMNGVAQLPVQSQPGYAMPQMQVAPNGQNNTATMHMVAYPQESILTPTPVPSPSVNAQQQVDRGWIGPTNGAYRPTPTPDAGPMQSGTIQSVPMQSAPIQGAPTPVYADQSYAGGGCAGGCNGGYNSSPVYGAMLAPAASSGGYAGYGAGCGPVYAQPVFAGPAIGAGNFAGMMRGYGAVPGKAFFAGGSALLMKRVDDHNVALSYNTAMPSENILGTRDARQGQLNGFEVFAGRYINGGRNAILLNYWGLYPEDNSAQVTGPSAPTTYDSRYPFTGIDMPTQSVADWFEGARAHRVTRTSQYHNIEANLLGFAAGGAARTWAVAAPRRGAFGVGGYGAGYAGGYGGGYGAGGCGTGSCGGGGYDCGGYDSCSTGSCGSGYSDCGGGSDCGSCGAGCASFTGPCGLTPNMCGSRLNWTWLGGFRYFRFKESLQYAASETDTVFNGPDDLYYDINVRNDLAGFQLGGAGTYCLGRRFNAYALTKGGIYNNHSKYTTSIYRSGGPEATVTSANIFNGQPYMVDASKNQAAFMGEFGTGVGARISRGWSANVGYRVIGVAGVATAVNNIPFDMTHLDNVADYNNTSSLLLHGWTLGGMYNF